MDEHTRESLADVVAYSIDADPTVDVLDNIAADRGRYPRFHPLRQWPGAGRERAQGPVPLQPGRDRRLHRSRLTLAEPLDGVPQPG